MTKWLRGNSGFVEQYVLARQASADLFAERIIAKPRRPRIKRCGFSADIILTFLRLEGDGGKAI